MKIKIRSIFLLLILALGILILPATANGPDYGTLQKNGTISLSGNDVIMINRNVVQWPVVDVFDIVRSRIVFNVTLLKFPIQFDLPSVRANTANPGGWIGIPPVTEAKLVFKESGTTHVLFNMTLRAYKQAFPYVDLSGEFTYVNAIYLSTMTGADIYTDLPTIIYDNITQYGSGTKNYYLYLDGSGDTVNLTHYIDNAGFYWAGAPGGVGSATWADSSNSMFYINGLASSIEYGVANDPVSFDKDIMINRPYYEQSHLQIFNNSGVGDVEELIYESPSTKLNETLHFLNTAALYKIYVNTTALNYTIFDDRFLAVPPPPAVVASYWIYTFDETTGNFLANTSVRLVNLTSGTAHNLLTNGYGMLRVSGILGDAHTSRGSKTNYISSDWSNQTVSGDTAAVQLMLWPIGVPPAGNCTVYWKVYDGTTSPYQPISGATIRISDGSVLLTDSAGTAQKNLLAWGNYTYSVEKTGFTGITRDLQPEGSTTFTQTIYLSKPEAVIPAPGIYDMNTEIGKLVDWIASTIFTLGVLIWLTLIFTVIGMFMLALRSLGGGSGTLFRTGLFPKNLFGRGGGRRGR